MKYFHVELDSHDVLIAEGAPAESYRDCGNRRNFENSLDEATTLHADWSVYGSCVRSLRSTTARLKAHILGRARYLGRGAEVDASIAGPGGARMCVARELAKNWRGDGAVCGRVDAGGAVPRTGGATRPAASPSKSSPLASRRSFLSSTSASLGGRKARVISASIRSRRRPSPRN